MPLLVHVDAFTDRPFTGNPAGVCLLDSPREDAWMQGIAREMNVSETAFLEPREAGFGLRWFTPVREVDICGHATIATAHVLFRTRRLLAAEPAAFHTRSGILTARLDHGWIDLDFPGVACMPASLARPYLDALGTRDPVTTCEAGPRWIVEVESPAAVRELAPDFRALASLPGRGIAVTARGDGRPYDFVSRYFAPWVGVDEDPVTGSVHCALAVFWGERLRKNEMLAFQASARGGELRLRLDGRRVHLGGRAVIIASGEVQG